MQQSDDLDMNRLPEELGSMVRRGMWRTWNWQQLKEPAFWEDLNTLLAAVYGVHPSAGPADGGCESAATDDTRSTRSQHIYSEYGVIPAQVPSAMV